MINKCVWFLLTPHIPTQTPALADVSWNTQVKQQPLITIILPGNGGSHVCSHEPPRGSRANLIQGQFAKDDEFHFSLGLLFPRSRRILPGPPERRAAAVTLQLTGGTSEKRAFVLRSAVLRRTRRFPHHTYPLHTWHLSSFDSFSVVKEIYIIYQKPTNNANKDQLSSLEIVLMWLWTTITTSN